MIDEFGEERPVDPDRERGEYDFEDAYKTVDIRFALFSFGGRYDLVYPRRGEQAIKLSWFMPANLIASTPFVVTQGAAASHAANGGPGAREGGREAHAYTAAFAPS